MAMNKVFVSLGQISVLFYTLAGAASAKEIIHDAEHYILEAQHGEEWAEQDKVLFFRFA